MREYHKIQSLFLRDPATQHRTFLHGQWSMPEFEYLADLEWTFTEKVDGTNIRVGVLRTVARTGSVITSAGLIFAASMFGLMAGSVAIMIQAGLIIGCGLLLDTFLVRTLTVPAIATLLRHASWWPNTHTHTLALATSTSVTQDYRGGEPRGRCRWF